MTLPTVTEQAQTWTVEGLQLAGLVSGPADGIPVLALHGWLDNAASFSALRPFLTQARLVAIDMPGHGLSDHRSTDSGYQIWDDLPQLAGLLDQFGWERCVLLGHSRGAMISTLLAAAFPERVDALITLDGMVPYPADDAAVVTQLRSFLKDRERQSRRPQRVFESLEDFVERRARSGEPSVIASQLATRALKQTDQGYAWRGDQRLSGASAIKLNRTQIEAVLSALDMPVLNIWATPSERMQRFYEMGRSLAEAHVKDQQSVDIPGHHHWHMEPEAAEAIGTAITAFLKMRLNTSAI